LLLLKVKLRSSGMPATKPELASCTWKVRATDETMPAT
jgi:hypothetical protein